MDGMNMSKAIRHEKIRTITNHSCSTTQPLFVHFSITRDCKQSQKLSVMIVMAITILNTATLTINTGTILHLQSGTNRRLGTVFVGVPRVETLQIANAINIAIIPLMMVKILIDRDCESFDYYEVNWFVDW
jgi:exosortase/archaeosortase